MAAQGTSGAISQPRIRPVFADELVRLHALIESAYRGESAKRGWTHEADLLGGQRTDIAALQDMVADPAQHLLVAADGTSLVGCVAVTVTGNAPAHIALVTVTPDRQSLGLGRRLLEAAEQCTRDSGATRAEMTVIGQRTELIAWYERRGYRRTGERRPFPLSDPRFGLPKRDDLCFLVLAKAL